MAWLPTEFAVYFADINIVAPVMPRAIGHKSHQLLVWRERRIGLQFIQDLADGAHDLDIGRLVIPTYAVGLSHTALRSHFPECFAVIIHIKPITDLHAVAING